MPINNTNSNNRYLVILADRQKGRFFTIYLGTFEDQGEEIVDKDVPQKVRNEGRPAKVQRHIKDHLNHHFKHVGSEALSYLVKKRVKQLDGVVIGGHQEFLSKLRQSLPPKLKNKIVAEVVSDIDVPVGDLTNKIVDEIKELEEL